MPSAGNCGILHPMPSNPSKLAHALARICANCPVCRQARRKQRGVAFQIVKHVETKVCPACRAYAKVTGRQAHEPIRPAHNDR